MKLPARITSKFARPMLKLQKVSPQIMFGAGVVGVVGAGVLACRATLKLSDVIENNQEEVDSRTSNAEINESYREGEYGADMAKLKIRLVLDITKLYAPAVGVAVVSIGLLTGSHITLNRRNAAGAAAYATLDQAYRQFQTRVEEKYGKDETDQLRHGTQIVEETVVKDDGKTKVVKHARSNGLSPYAQLFEESNVNWQPNPNMNWFFLHAQQRYWNNYLQTHGYVFLNDVLDSLGFEKTKAGQVVGWIAGEYQRDGYIDFGLGEDEDRVRDFMLNGEGNAWVDFNVDGMVLDMAF